MQNNRRDETQNHTRPSPAASPPEDPLAITGCWSAPERLLALEGQQDWVNVWFHFFEGGEAILSMRRGELEPRRVHGQWQITSDTLVASFSDSLIRAPFRIEGDVLLWAGERLLRIPDGAASLPFGIQLPYRLSPPEHNLRPGLVKPPKA